jgi:hypothetical protein
VRRAILFGCVLALLGCGGQEAARGPVRAPASSLPTGLLHLYDYDASAPLDVRETESRSGGDATVHDISYAGPKSRIAAFLVLPNGDGPFPAVLFMPGALGGRYTFFTEAVELAERGIASLLPDPPYSRPPIEATAQR